MSVTHSIIIPTHNRPEQLRRAVRSAIAAAGETGEVIVVDDASDTPAEQVLSDLAFDRLHHFRDPVPQAGGGSPARNTGALHAKAGVLFFLDDDDELIEGYCESILSDTVQQQAAFGFSAREFVPADPNKGTTVETRDLSTGVIPPDADFYHRAFPFSAGFWLKKTTYGSIGPMERGLRTNSDTEYACSLYASKLPGWYSAEPGVRIHEHIAHPAPEMLNVTQRTRSSDRADAFAAIARKHAAFLEADTSAGQFVYSRWAKHAARAGRRTEALEALGNIRPWTARAKTFLLTLPMMKKAKEGSA